MFVVSKPDVFFDAGDKLLPWLNIPMVRPEEGSCFAFLIIPMLSGPEEVAFVILETMPNRLTKWELLRAGNFVFGSVITHNSYELL